MSKAYKGKPCAYCGRSSVSTTADHVIARAFFLEVDRANLPKVPACRSCNNVKSAHESDVAATLVVGSRHIEADEIRQRLVKPRLARNRRLEQAVIRDSKKVWLNINGVIQPMVAVTIDAKPLRELMTMIVKGLFYHHFRRPLAAKWDVAISQHSEVDEALLWEKMQPAFPPGCTAFTVDLGRGAFWYEGARSVWVDDFTVWRMAWHGGIPLHGENTPPEGVKLFWGVTRPKGGAAVGLSDLSGRRRGAQES